MERETKKNVPIHQPKRIAGLCHTNRAEPTLKIVPHWIGDKIVGIACPRPLPLRVDLYIRCWASVAVSSLRLFLRSAHFCSGSSPYIPELVYFDQCFENARLLLFFIDAHWIRNTFDLFVAIVWKEFQQNSKKTMKKFQKLKKGKKIWCLNKCRGF